METQQTARTQPKPSRIGRWKRKAAAGLLGIIASAAGLGVLEVSARLDPRRPTELLTIKKEADQEYIVYNKTTERKVRPEIENTLKGLKIPINNEKVDNIFFFGGSNVAGGVSGPNSSPAPMLQFALSEEIKLNRSYTKSLPLVHKLGFWGQGFSTHQEITSEITALNGKGTWVFYAGHNQGLQHELTPALLENITLNRATNWLWDNFKLYKRFCPKYILPIKKLTECSTLESNQFVYKSVLLKSLKERIKDIVKKTNGNSIIICTVMPNEKRPPFLDSNVYESIKDKKYWDTLTQKGLEALVNNQSQEAISAFEKMREVESDSPFLSFLLAQAYEKHYDTTKDQSSLKKAQFFYQLFQEQDRTINRVFPSLNQTIRDLIKEESGSNIHLVDTEKLARDKLRKGIFGSESLSDWCHLTTKAHYNFVVIPVAKTILKIQYGAMNNDLNLKSYSDYLNQNKLLMFRYNMLTSAAEILGQDMTAAKERIDEYKQSYELTDLIEELTKPISFFKEGKEKEARLEIEKIRKKYCLESINNAFFYLPAEDWITQSIQYPLFLIERGCYKPAREYLIKKESEKENSIGKIEDRELSAIIAKSSVNLTEGKINNSLKIIKEFLSSNPNSKVTNLFFGAHSILNVLIEENITTFMIDPSLQRQKFKIGNGATRLPSMRRVLPGKLVIQTPPEYPRGELEIYVDDNLVDKNAGEIVLQPGHHRVLAVSDHHDRFALAYPFVDSDSEYTPEENTPTLLEIEKGEFTRLPKGTKVTQGMLRAKNDTKLCRVDLGGGRKVLFSIAPVGTSASYEQADKEAQNLEGRLPKREEWEVVANEYKDEGRQKEYPTMIHKLCGVLTNYLKGGEARARRKEVLSNIPNAQPEFIEKNPNDPSCRIAITPEGHIVNEDTSSLFTAKDSSYHLVYDLKN